MRIVGGRWRGRRLRPPSDNATRPTADRVREAWMSIVLPGIQGAKVLDLFAGSGALGLEALSRGAEEAHFVENSPRALHALKANVEQLEAGPHVSVLRMDAMRYMEGLPAGAYDIAFADPPYGLGLASRIAARWIKTPFAYVLGIEHGVSERLPEGGDTRKYGDTAVTFYRSE